MHLINPGSVEFFSDETFVDADGVRSANQEIFDEVFRMIDEAEHYVLLDVFLYNNFTGTETSVYRQLSRQLTDKLIAKKKSNPKIIIQVITDPINTIYGGYKLKDFELLKEAGISVIITDLKPLRPNTCLLYTSPSPRDRTRSRMPSSA